MLTSDGASLILEIAAPRADHDRLLREGMAPIVRALSDAPELEAAYFERFNKPDWGIRLHVLGSRPWIEDHARTIVEGHLADLGVSHAYVDDVVEDKWIGGRRDGAGFLPFHHADSKACLDLLEAEGAGALGTSRGQWSLLLVEELLNLFGLSEGERLEFYRRGFAWSSDLGRWDAEVFDALERKLAVQHEALQQAISFPAGGVPDDAWGGVTPASIARELLAAMRAPITALLLDSHNGAIARTPVELAVLAGHAHSNRLGVPPTQEATMRYLIWRTRGGRRAEAP